MQNRQLLKKWTSIIVKVEKKEAERPSTATIKEAPAPGNAPATAPSTTPATDNSTAPHKEESATINKSANKETHASAKPVTAKDKSVAAKPTLKKDVTTGSRSNSITGQMVEFYGMNLYMFSASLFNFLHTLKQVHSES